MTALEQAQSAAGLLDRLAVKRSLTVAELRQAAGAADAVAGYCRDLSASLGKVNAGGEATGTGDLAKRAAGIAQRAGVLLAKFGGTRDAHVSAALPNPLAERGSGDGARTASHHTSGTGLDPAAVHQAYEDYWRNRS